MQHAGVLQLGHDRQQGVQAGVALAGAGGAAAVKLRQTVVQRAGEAGLGLGAGTADAVALAHPFAVARRLRRHMAILQPRQTRGAQGHAFRARLRFLGGGSDQQAQRPDRPAVGVDPAGDFEHLHLAVAAEAAEGLAQGHVDLPGGLAGGGHVVEGGPQRPGRGVHQLQAEVTVGAAAATVDQRRLGRQLDLVDQRLDGEIGERLGQAQLRACRNPGVHHQLLNLAGGL
ncbi:hypothetical protein D3C84_572790 [compost metagenome]